MHLSTRLDCELVAVEQTDELTLLVELADPDVAASAGHPRPGPRLARGTGSNASSTAEA